MKKYDKTIIFKLNTNVKARIGENGYMILGIISVLLTFSGLFVGLIGRGWLGAWFLVLLGMTVGFFPCVDHIFENKIKERRDRKDDLQNFDLDEELLKQLTQIDMSARQAARVQNAKERYFERNEKDRRKNQLLTDQAVIELEAALARRKLEMKAEEERRIASEIEEAERLRRILKQKEEFARIAKKRREEEKKRAERKKKEEEERRRNSYNQRVFRARKGNIIRKRASFFEGVKNGEELKHRYKELIKRYHPDNGGADDGTIDAVKKEYEELARFFISYDKHNKST